MRIVYMGTPDFAVDPLQKLAASEHEVVAVFCQPDKPRGRSGQPAFPPVKEAAVALGIPVYQPVKIREPEYLDIIRELKPDVAVVVAFGQILPQTLLDIPTYGCINVHASLLPMYRGAAPIQWSIINGDAQTGVTIQQMDAGLDTGDILMTKVIDIAPEETSESLFNKLSLLGGPMVLDVLQQMEAGTTNPVPQGEATTPYAKMMTKEMGQIDWNESAVAIERKIRAFNSWPCAYTQLEDKVMKIWTAKVTEETTDQPAGSVVLRKNRMLVQTGDTLLELTEVQLAGKKRMPVDAFLRGVKLEEPLRLGE